MPLVFIYCYGLSSTLVFFKLAQMNIQILGVNPFLYTLCLVGCLSSNLYGQQQSDTISNEIMLLEKQLGRWQDSIAHVQQALKKIIEDQKQTRGTKEKAVFTLATIHNTQVLDYLFENEEKLQFTKLDSEDSEAWEQEFYRTAMVAIGDEYFYKESTEAEKWLLLNYLLHDIKEVSFREIALVNCLLTLPERYKSPELLLEFMCANASPNAQKVLEWFLPKKDTQKK